GTVTGDGVRVYAGSDYVKPLNSTKLQGKLDRSEKVKLLGEQLDDYYKIAPPAFAYLWVSTDFTKPLGSVSEIPLAGPNGTLVVGPEMISADARLEAYYALEKQIKAEQAKPMDQQNYAKIKKALVRIANVKAGDKAARYAEFMVKQIEGFELALAVAKEVELQNGHLQKIKGGIDKARARRLAEVEDMGRFVVIGQFATFRTYGTGHYRIVDESGKTTCYALPTGQASTMDLSKLVKRKVGLVGTIEPHPQTAGALVRFTKIVKID
ncbi:MAG: SH3 domain-containing protein, partial [Planctomycetota bacterium]